MKYIFLFFIGMLYFFTYAQSDSLNNPSTTDFKERIEIKFPEKLMVEQIKPEVIKENYWIKSIPWIIALIIGILTVVVNIYLSKKLRESAERNLNLQLNNAKEITIAQLKGTVATKNRQEWINELRHNITEVLTHSLFLIANDDTPDTNSEKLTKIIFAKFKIELLINDQKPDQVELMDKIQNLVEEIGAQKKMDEIKIINFRQDIINASRKVFGTHWQKIKNLQ